jgi:hypothetical protein
MEIDKGKLQKMAKLIYEMASNGFTKAEIAKKLGISVRKLGKMMADYEELESAYEEGLSESIRQVEQSLFKRAIGYNVTERKKRITVGQFGEQYVREEEIERHVPADVNAIIFYLKNRAPDRWTDKHELALNMDKIEKFHIEFVSPEEKESKVINVNPYEELENNLSEILGEIEEDETDE